MGASLFISLLALCVAGYAIYKGNRNSSVATLVTLFEASRQAWQRFLSAETEDIKWYELAELMNLLEIASAILNEKSFAGASKDLLRDYLNEVVSLLRNDQYASSAIERMFSAPTTFEHIRKFYNAKSALSVTKPKQWFQS
jgi:hypothetical protein